MKINQESIINCIRIAKQYFEETPHAAGHKIVGKTKDSFYQGTKITTKLYAIKGPQSTTFSNFKLFVEETSIKNIIALGFPGDRIKKKDFINYGFLNTRGNVALADGDLGKLDPKNFANNIYGTLFVIKDAESLNGADDTVMTALLDSYLHSLTEPTVVHCKAGTGRTGHVIMIFLFFEFLFHVERMGLLDKLDNEADLLGHFKKILTNVRKLVPKFVHNCDQFVNSIDNAFYLYQKVKALPLEHTIQQLLLTRSPHLSEIAEYAFLSLEVQAKKVEEKHKTSPANHPLKTMLIATDEEKLESDIQACSHEIGLNRSSVDLYLHRAHLYYQRNKNGLAISDYSMVIQLAATQSEAYLLARGNRAFLYNIKKIGESAIDDYKAVIKGYSEWHKSAETAADKSQYAMKIADMHERIASIYLLRGEYDSAESHYNDALKWDPNIIFNPDCSEINAEKKQHIADKYPELYSHLEEAFLSHELQGLPLSPISKVSEKKEKITASSTDNTPTVIVQITEPVPITPAQATTDKPKLVDKAASIQARSGGPQFFQTAAQLSPGEAYTDTKSISVPPEEAEECKARADMPARPTGL